MGGLHAGQLPQATLGLAPRALQDYPYYAFYRFPFASSTRKWVLSSCHRTSVAGPKYPHFHSLGTQHKALQGSGGKA